MRNFIYILIFILPFSLIAQDETGKINGNTYNVIYNLKKPENLFFKNDGLAYKIITVDTINSPDSVNTRYILLGARNFKTVELAKKLVLDLRKGSNFDSIAMIYRTNRDYDISENYTGWFTKGKMVRKYELFCFAQDSQRIGWIDTEFSVFLIEILAKSSSNSKLTIPIYENTPFTGQVKDLDSNSNLISVSNWKDGLRHGKTIEYWENSRKKIESYFVEGKKNKYYKEWFNNGQIKHEVIYQKGKWKKSKLWNYDGELISNSNSKNSIKIDIDN